MTHKGSTASVLPGPASADRVLVRRMDAGLVLPGEGDLHVAIEVRIPAAVSPGQSLGQPAIALVCLPGGGMNRRFFDLMPVPRNGVGADDSFSFARQMSARGFITILVDHLGVGESSRPKDAYALTPERIMQANAKAIEQVCTELRTGRLAPELPALPELITIGVGHSMGATLTILQQAQHCRHTAIAVLGFSTRGLPEHLTEEARVLAGVPGLAREKLLELARTSFGVYPRLRRSIQSGELFAAEHADPRGIEALKPALAPILPVPAMLGMLPGNVAPEAARIGVPVFIGLGERDLTGPSHQVPAAFSASREVTLHILPAAGHSHFLFPARAGLFARLGTWARSLSRE